MTEATQGEQRVVADFNPSGDDAVAEIKRRSADLIDFINELPERAHPEFRRWQAEAKTNIETGAMYGVKAATAREQ